ncbi:MAG: glycosyltransferase family 2 protein [Desulfobulbaceae bacterium]|nr:glycosyltransferase family 2 protein [Desulfobulbaceae bacterium]
MQTMTSCVEFFKNHRIKIIKYGAFFLCLLSLGLMGLESNQLVKFRTMLTTSTWLHPLTQIGFCIVASTTIFYSWLAWNAFRYRPITGVSDDKLPNVTVVVPAYNEGALVQLTLRSLATGDYPAKKLQLIAIDDGSQDNTWQYIQDACREFPGRIKAIRQMKNRGKRHALYEGFNRATGEVLVTVDSDSIVDPDTLRNLVSPFVGDPDCGAVAGNVRVLNRQEIIPRMLEVSFVFSFEFIRSAQSVMRTVLCTPGALAAYRRDLVLNVLDEWLNQKFFGREANIGEDRAITNLILRQGKSVLFQRNATVYTNVPVHYNNLCKMMIRWGRSNVREALKMGGFVFGNFRAHHRMSARLLLCIQCLWCASSPVLFMMMLSLIILFPVQFAIVSLGGGALWSTVSAFFYTSRYRSSEALWAYGYGVFHFCALAWITPYSLLTAQRSGWLTREITGVAPLSRGQAKRSTSTPLFAALQK